MGHSFHGLVLEIDGMTYKGCDFNKCELVYRGGQLPTMDRNRFVSSGLNLVGDGIDRQAELLDSLKGAGEGDLYIRRR